MYTSPYGVIRMSPCMGFFAIKSRDHWMALAVSSRFLACSSAKALKLGGTLAGLLILTHLRAHVAGLE